MALISLPTVTTQSYWPPLRIPSQPPGRLAVKTNIYRKSGQSMNRVNLAFAGACSGTKKGTFSVGAASVTLIAENAPGQNFGGFAFLDVVVRGRRTAYRGWKWNVRDMVWASMVAFLHLLCLLAPFTFSWAAFGVAAGLYVVTGLLGITLSYHRNLSHRSLKVPKWLEYFFAYCGVQAFQGDPIDWVRTHRFHHKFTDTERDPHSPIGGFWHSYASWYFDTDTILQTRYGEPNNVKDLEKQAFYKFMERTYLIHPIAFGVLLYAIGGIPFVVWGMNTIALWIIAKALVVKLLLGSKHVEITQSETSFYV